MLAVCVGSRLKPSEASSHCTIGSGSRATFDKWVKQGVENVLTGMCWSGGGRHDKCRHDL